MKRTITRAEPAPPRRDPALLEDEDYGDGTPLAAPDPLAAEPLTADEAKAIETHAADIDEEREGGLEALRKLTEVKLPIDPDAGDALSEGNDERLEVHLRPKHKRR